MKQLTISLSAQRGSALISAMVSAAVLSVGILGLAKLGSSNSYKINQAKQTAEATMYAQNLIEQFRSVEGVDSSVTTTVSGATTTNTVGSVDGSNVENSNYESISGVTSSFSRTWSVTEDASTGTKNVVVSVNWSDSKGQTQTVTLASKLASVDPADSGRLMLSPSSDAITFTAPVVSDSVEVVTDNGNGNNGNGP